MLSYEWWSSIEKIWFVGNDVNANKFFEIPSLSFMDFSAIERTINDLENVFNGMEKGQLTLIHWKILMKNYFNYFLCISKAKMSYRQNHRDAPHFRLMFHYFKIRNKFNLMIFFSLVSCLQIQWKWFNTPVSSISGKWNHFSLDFNTSNGRQSCEQVLMIL